MIVAKAVAGSRTVHDERVVVYRMPAQNDLFVRGEFEQHMYDVVLSIDVQYRK
jgi:hypothetical protein